MIQDVEKKDYVVTRIKGGTDNCYIVSDGKNAILFDTSSGECQADVLEALSKYDLKLVVLSHPHFDHAENAALISDLLFSMVDKYSKTLLLVTHDMNLASRGDIQCCIKDGKLSVL